MHIPCNKNKETICILSLEGAKSLKNNITAADCLRGLCSDVSSKIIPASVPSFLFCLPFRVNQAKSCRTMRKLLESKAAICTCAKLLSDSQSFPEGTWTEPRCCVWSSPCCILSIISDTVEKNIFCVKEHRQVVTNHTDRILRNHPSSCTRHSKSKPFLFCRWGGHQHFSE